SAQEPPDLLLHRRVHRRRPAGRRPRDDRDRDAAAGASLRGVDLAVGLPRPPLAAHAPSRRSDVMRSLSADWVLPVDGSPIRDGYVAWEVGLITNVGLGRADD